MLTYCCPSCWKSISNDVDICPTCGYDLKDFSSQTYEEKLLLALHHPVPDIRMLAVRNLGELHSQVALAKFERILEDLGEDPFVMRETLAAAAKIDGEAGLQLIQGTTQHPFNLVKHKAQELIEKIEYDKDHPGSSRTN